MKKFIFGFIFATILQLVNTNPIKWINRTKLIYNRVGKTGSTEMLSLLGRLKRQNSFTIKNQHNFYPNASMLRSEIHDVRIGEVYVNHAHFIATNDTNIDVAWFNIVREPVDRQQSMFYYAVDDGHRRKELASQTLKKRAEDALCGCAYLEFDECIRKNHHNGCEKYVLLNSQSKHWCQRDEADCSLDVRIHRLHHEFAVVGLTEQYALTVQLLEALLPRFFRGARVQYSNMKPARVTSEESEFAHFHMTGAVSKEARRILLNYTHNREEIAFYKAAERLFWQRVSMILPHTFRDDDDL